MRLQKQLMIALGLGGVAFCLVIVAAWLEVSPAAIRYTSQEGTRNLVRGVAGRLRAHIKEHGAPPADLEELDGSATDSWDRPLHFEMTDAGPVVSSLGRDGVPGGTGPDADLYSDDRYLDAAHPTLRQFLTDDTGFPVFGFFVDALVAAGIVALATLRVLRHEFSRSQPARPARAVIEIILVAVFATIVGILLLPLHIPSGH